MSVVPKPSDQAASTGSQVPGEPRLLSWKAVVKRAIVTVIAGVALYFVAPKIVAVFTSFPQLASVDFIWLGAALVAQAAHFACTFALQRIALRTKAWFPVITAQLAGNAISLIMPGGAAAGAAVQFRMLATSGMDAGDAVGGLTAFSLLGVAGLLALPVFALPAILFGTPINHSLFDAALLGIVGFVFLAGFSAAVLLSDRPLQLVARAVQWVRNRVILRRRPPLTGLEGQLLKQRDLIRGVLGQQWWKAVLLSAGRLVFDFLCLLCALRAVGSRPNPALVLIAYAATGIIGLIPITPGGLGIVEASLTGFLVLAGVNSGDAVLATLAYRLASYWLPMVSGPVAYAIFKRRYRHAPPPASDKAEALPA
ncbi:MAG TPA: lysylphosphatidylglycerol synthase transmembrane domain-containing protein [Acidimicrobiales bacterium]